MRPRRLLAPIDFSPPSLTAAELAVGWARGWEAELHLAHVWWSGLSPETLARESSLQAARNEIEEKLEALAEELTTGERPIRTHLVSGPAPGPAIVELVRELEADLVVAGAHGRRGLRRWVVGSVTEGLARDLPVDLLCVHQRASGAEGLPGRILLPVDFSEPSQRAVERAPDLVGPDAVLGLVHVLEDLEHPGYFDLFRIEASDVGSRESREILEGIQERLEEWAERIRERVGTVETLVLRGRPAEAIVRHAPEWGADWIVLSSHGRHGIEAYLTGSVTQRVLQRSPLPVLVVPGPERSS